jgi:hypothetical protein
MKPRLFLLCFFSIYSFSKNCFALVLETASDRKVIATEKSRKFERSNRINQYISLSGYYDSDYNSYDYNLSARYKYQSNSRIIYTRFDHSSKYKIQVKISRDEPTKYSEFYELTISHKERIMEQNNYIAFYNNTQYDDMSKYYYDVRSAIGLGRFFFDQNLEFDLSIGYRDVKNYDQKNVNVIPSFRVNIDLTDKLKFVQRGFLFIDYKSMDNELSSKLIYDLNSKTSLQLSHEFDQRRYEDDSKESIVNQVSRKTTIGLIYRF